MNSAKTIDVTGLGHDEKGKLIFPGVNELKTGDFLRIIAEFNPLPLVHVLKAKGEFEVSYEKEGPEKWILIVKRVAPKEDTKENFKKLLTELKGGGVSSETREKVKAILQAVDAETLGVLEQELIRGGVSHGEIKKSLCDIHLEVARDDLVSKRMEVTAPHPVHTFMEEHKVILDSLNELGPILKSINGKDSFEAMGGDLEKIQDISHHLVEAESHHQREEEVLFPKLEKHNIVEPPEIMKLDHAEFRKRKQNLYKLVHNYQDHSFNEFRTKAIQLGNYLIGELESHIFKEDNILYQIALQVLGQDEWEEVKKGCDKIGYCCFTPEDYKGAAKIFELDLRPMPPSERHEKIFSMWYSLEVGQILKIINDHDPKPLRYQFEAEHKDKYEWEYEQEGPKNWVVKIKKL